MACAVGPLRSSAEESVSTATSSLLGARARGGRGGVDAGSRATVAILEVVGRGGRDRVRDSGADEEGVRGEATEPSAFDHAVAVR